MSRRKRENQGQSDRTYCHWLRAQATPTLASLPRADAAAERHWLRSFSRDGITPVRSEMTWTSSILSGVEERRKQFWSLITHARQTDRRFSVPGVFLPSRDRRERTERRTDARPLHTCCLPDAASVNKPSRIE